MTLLGLLLAGGLGGLARYEVAGLVHRRTGSARPWGTATVNLSGALALGLLAGLHTAGTVPDGLATLAGTGFLGGFTTFSTWMVESVHLSEEAGAAGLRTGAVNLVGMLVLGVLAAVVGHVLAS